LAGIAIAWIVGSGSTGGAPGRNDDAASNRGPFARLSTPRGRLAVVCAALAVAPDLDILFTVHRAAWHSVTAAILAGVAGALLAPLIDVPARRALVANALAWGSHVLLDWLGRDQSSPQGVMAFWPFSRAYVASGLDVFAEVSRRYWRPDEFIVGNLRALVRELAIILPVVGLVWRLRRRRRVQ
jgi:hypothetical protein